MQTEFHEKKYSIEFVDIVSNSTSAQSLATLVQQNINRTSSNEGTEPNDILENPDTRCYILQLFITSDLRQAQIIDDLGSPTHPTP